MNPFYFLSDLVNLLKKYDEGRIFLTAGNHAHKILTKGTPVQVWVSETDTGNAQVCGGDVNYYGVTLLEDGFVLYAQVATDFANFDWEAKLES